MIAAKKILLVEDHVDTLAVTKLLLERRGYYVITAMDVATGIHIGTLQYFDILVADIGLPDGKGWEVLEALRKIKSFPAIAVSAYCNLDDEREYIAKGFQQCIPKPHDFNMLVEAIREAIDNFSSLDISLKEA